MHSATVGCLCWDKSTYHCVKTGSLTGYFHKVLNEKKKAKILRMITKQR